jgi:CheY-like chemotaxis protein
MPLPTALVIDDDGPARGLVVHALRDHYAVHEAASVAAALEAVRQWTPDVVVLDLCLDREPGELHAALVRRGLPVVLVSGQEPGRLPAEAEARGWTYLTKPVDPPVLAAAVDAAYATREERMTPTIPPGTRPTAPTPPPSATASPVPTTPQRSILPTAGQPHPAVVAVLGVCLREGTLPNIRRRPPQRIPPRRSVSHRHHERIRRRRGRRHGVGQGHLQVHRDRGRVARPDLPDHRQQPIDPVHEHRRPDNQRGAIQATGRDRDPVEDDRC